MDLTFPNSLENRAINSAHLCPKMLKNELLSFQQTKKYYLISFFKNDGTQITAVEYKSSEKAMNYTKQIITGLIATALLCSAGCGYDKTADEPFISQRTEPAESQQNFQNQADNAVLSSMTVADIHFLPYRPQLNSLGRGRLTAIATYLEQYGGEVTVDSDKSDEAIKEKRITSVRHFLVGQGLDPERLTVVPGLTQGRGQDANEATVFYYSNLGNQGSSSESANADASGG